MELLLRKISSDELNALLELSPQPVVACTINGNIQFLNDRFVQLTGISREELTGSTLVKSKIAEYDFISAIVEDFKEHRFPESREIHLNSYSGKGSEFLVSAQMVEYEGCQLLITFYGDIPERKALLLKPDNSNRFTDSLNSISAGPRDLCRFELLTWINGELLHSDNPQAVVQNICEKVMEYLMCEIFLNYLVDEKCNLFILNAFAGISEENAREIRDVISFDDLSGIPATSGKHISSKSSELDRDSCNEILKSYGIKAFASFLMTDRDAKIIGTLSFGSKSKESFTDDDLVMMKAVADQVGVVMIRIHTDHKLRMYHDELEMLVEKRTAELKKSEQRLSAAINATGGGIFETSFPPGENCFFSDRLFEIFEIPEARHHDCSKLRGLISSKIHPEDRTGLKTELEKFLAGKTAVFSVEMRLRKNTGEWRYIQTMAYPSLRDENGYVKKIVGVILDITEKKELEGKLFHSQKMESLGRLAGGIAHDFNNMLQVITACSYRMMKNAGNSSELLKDIEVIREAAQSSARLSHRLLAFSSKQMLQPRLLCVNKVVKRIYKLLSNSLRENVKVSLNLDGDVGDVFMDPDQFEQTIVNMVVNAQNAIPESGHISISTSNVTFPSDCPYKHEAVAGGRYVMIAISDTGCGMDTETLGRIFDPFFTTRQKDGGTGLGLSSAYAVVKQSGGVIRVYSTPGKGSTFKIFLPLKEKCETEIQSVDTLSRIINSRSTALVVDDNPHTRRFVVNILQDLGCKVFEANNAEGALVVSRSYDGNITVMITDIVMPGISGVELAGIIKTERPSMPILYMTGFEGQKPVDYFKSEDNVVLLRKPFSVTDLQNAIVKALGFSGWYNDGSSVKEKRSKPPVNSKNSSKLRILIVDDETVSAECIAFLIRKNGSIVEIAGDGKSALAIAERLVPDVIILDIRLPDMDGYELAERIRALPCCRMTRLVACSGCNPVEDKVNLFDEYLVKPLDMMELMQILTGDALAV